MYLTNESPMQANLRRAYGQWNEELLESCAKQSEFRSIAFALAYFHAALQERKKFGVGNLPGATSGAKCSSRYSFDYYNYNTIVQSYTIAQIVWMH